MGSHQENWFHRQLSESEERGATWRVIGNQMIFSRMNMSAEGGRVIDTDAWDGYVSTRNRTFKHIYENKIDNVIMLAGDSHQNWVSDLIWLGEHEYDPVTGEGSVGVEFAVTAVTSDGLEGTLHEAEEISHGFVEDNVELQWQEGYYRGYLELHVSHEKIDAEFYGCPTVATRNAHELPIANFTVFANQNHLARPLGGGVVEAGAMKDGDVRSTNLTYDTLTKEWSYVAFETMFLPLLEWEG
jgi:alkaline phosphatase D